MKKNIRIISGIVAILLFLAPLVLVSCKGKKDASMATEKAAVRYHCPMHPAYVSDKPGDCPICGMKLVPFEPDGSAAKDGGAVLGRAAFSLTPERENLIGVESARVEKRALEKPIRASGRVAYDPELYSAIREHILAVTALHGSDKSAWPEAQARAASLVQASRLRLQQKGLSESQIEDLSNTDANATSLLVGNDEGPLWVYAQLYAEDAALVRAGNRAEVSASAFPGERFEGVVVSLDPVFDRETRSLKARVQVQNRHGLLKPDMYVDVLIRVPLGKRLSVPTSALIETGDRTLVFVKTKTGRFDPHEIRVGREAGGYVEVLSGLEEGMDVVASGNFLVDSESKLKAALP